MAGPTAAAVSAAGNSTVDAPRALVLALGWRRMKA
jgi:hypothetical protein